MTFNTFWSIYPRRINRRQAELKFNLAIKKGVSHEVIIRGATDYQSWCIRNETPNQYIAHPATWLNQQRWDNSYELDDSNVNTKGAGHQHRQGKTSLAMAAAAKVAQKNQAKMAMEGRSEWHGGD